MKYRISTGNINLFPSIQALAGRFAAEADLPHGSIKVDINRKGKPVAATPQGAIIQTRPGDDVGVVIEIGENLRDQLEQAVQAHNESYSHDKVNNPQNLLTLTPVVEL